MNDFVEKYDPAKAMMLSPEEIEAMKDFTNDELKQLAQAYPNSAYHQNYLVLYDTKKQPKDQIYQSTTWATFYNLRARNGMKNLYALTFKSLFFKPAIPPASVVTAKDISDAEVQNAPGINRQAYVPRVNRVTHAQERADAHEELSLKPAPGQGGVSEVVNANADQFEDVPVPPTPRKRVPTKRAKKK